MILSNTVATSVVLNGATSTVNTPADTLAPLGFGVVSNGENWRGWPGTNQPVVAAVTATATTNLDWSQGGLFQVNYPATTLAVTFTFTNVQVGQTIQMWSKQSASSASTVTWPSGIIWYGGGSGVPSTSTSAIDLTNDHLHRPWQLRRSGDKKPTPDVQSRTLTRATSRERPGERRPREAPAFPEEPCPTRPRLPFPSR